MSSSMTGDGQTIYEREGVDPLERLIAAGERAEAAIKDLPKTLQTAPWPEAPQYETHGLSLRDNGWGPRVDLCSGSTYNSVEKKILSGLLPTELLTLSEQAEAWALSVEQEAARRIAAEKVAYKALLAEQDEALEALKPRN